jgi:hypothetical protein
LIGTLSGSPDGVDIVAREDSAVYFNLDGDAALEKTAWAGRSDGFLVIDLAGGAGSEALEAAFARRTGRPEGAGGARCGIPAMAELIMIFSSCAS